MNTISSVRPYMTIKNNSQVSTNQSYQSQAPAFKGAIGQKVVQDITAKKAVTVASILAMVGGMLGLSKDKVSDVMEELVGKIQSLMGKNEELESQNLELKKTLINIKSEKEAAKKNFEDEKQQMQAGITHALVEKDLEIAKKDAKIAELQRYEGMAKVKSVDELDIVSPEQFVELLKTVKDAQPQAEASLLNYLFKGNGQEEFLAQIEKYNQIQKAINDGITKMPEMENLISSYRKLGLYIGGSTCYVAQGIMESALKNNEQGRQINYPLIKEQIRTNADAIITSFPYGSKYLDFNSNAEVLDKVSDYYTRLDKEKQKMLDEGWKFESRTVHPEKGPYMTFTKESEGQKFEVFESNLAYGSKGYGRLTLADGRTHSNLGDKLWEGIN